jgi:hypothetical protein
MTVCGKNREFADCARCGHPRMAHMGGSCHCGCRGGVPKTATSASTKAERREVELKTMARRAKSQSPAWNPPTSESASVGLMSFAAAHMSELEKELFLQAIASAEGYYLDGSGSSTWRDLNEFVRNRLPEVKAVRYPEVLESRLARGERLIQKGLRS